MAVRAALQPRSTVTLPSMKMLPLAVRTRLLASDESSPPGVLQL